MAPHLCALVPLLLLPLASDGAPVAAAASSEACPTEAPVVANQLLQSRTQLRSTFVAHPVPESFSTMLQGHQKRVNSSELVKMPLSIPKMQSLWVYGYALDEDRWVSGAVARRGSWEGDGVQQICDVFKTTPGTGYAFLDVGGNIGTITLPVASFLASRGGRVFSIEAMPSIAEHLRAGIVENGLQNVDLYNYAVSDPSAKDELIMALNPVNKGMSSVGGNAAWTQDAATKVRVPLTTLDSMLDMEPDLEKVLVAKMDIEGNEGRALKGATRLLREAPPCYLMIELQPQWLVRTGTPVEEVGRILSDAGYDVSQIHPTQIQTYRLQQRDLAACLARVAAAVGKSAPAALATSTVLEAAQL